MQRTRAFLLLAAMPPLAIGAAILAHQQPTAATAPVVDGVAVAPATRAQRAWIDPATGRFGVPSSSELAAEAELRPLEDPQAERLRVDAEGLWQEPLPGGGYRVDLQGRFASATVATLDAEGRLTTRCVEVEGAHPESEGEEGRHDH